LNNGEQKDPRENEPDLPDPEFEPIRNFAALPESIRKQMRDGLFLALGKAEESAIRVATLWGLLEHFDKLYQTVQAYKSGKEVNRFGALASIAGGKELEALPAFEGSFALPLRLKPPDGQLVGEDFSELDELANLISPETDLEERLPELPERIGDELRQFYRALASGGTHIRVEVIRDGQAVTNVEVGADEAQLKVAWLEEKTSHSLGTKTLRGNLFRIDTKKNEIAIDVLDATEGEANVEKATYEEEQLDELREALKHQVEVEVSVSEDRRPYERSVTSPTLQLTSIRRIEEEKERS